MAPAPFRDRGQNLRDLPRSRGDNYSLSDRNPFGVKLRRLSPKSARCSTRNSGLSPPSGSDPAKFYLLTTADQITATFQTIGTNLTKLRVAQ
jgi:hypothetical protein